MKTLYVLRHAKSDRSDPAAADHDRPLARRGERAAPVIGRYLAQRGWRPDLVLSSTARRARDTAALVAAQWPEPPPVETDRMLYLRGPATIVDRIALVDDGVARLMVVGHNPDFQALAFGLTAPSDERRAQLATRFPTGALAVLELPVGSWTEIREGAGRLIDLVEPKLLV